MARAPALATERTVYVFDHLGYGQSEQREGQDLSLAAQARRFVALLDHWGLDAPSVVANDIGGAIVLRALLLDQARYRDLTIFDAVSGGMWERRGRPWRPSAMPMDAYRDGEQFVVAFDLPGVDPEAVELDVERNVLTVKAERRPVVTGQQVEMQVAERPLGVFSRQLFLGDALDTEHIDAHYEAGVLTLRIPIAERAKPRKIAIAGGREHTAINV